MQNNTIRSLSLLAVVVGTLALQGCSVFRDFKTPRFTCGLPNGTGCKPVSEVYKLSVAGRLKASSTTGKANTDSSSTGTADAGAGKASAKPVATVVPTDPVLSQPRQLRLWLGRWEDRDGDLHDETYLYLRLDNGQWLLP